MKRTILFSLLFLTPYLNFSQCSNLTDGGVIGYDETGCGPFDPAPIQNVQAPSGGFGTIEYMWILTYDPNNYGMQNAIPGANSNTYDPPMISQTTWFVRCTRRAGCTTWVGESMVVKIVNPISATASAIPYGCNNDGGQITINTVGGTFPFTYTLNGQSFTNGSAAAPGTYTWSVTDGNGCTVDGLVTVAQSNFGIDVDVIDTPCSFLDDYAVVTPTGGTPPYTYSWSNGDTDAILNDPVNGIQGYYVVTVTDANGCELSEVVKFDEGGPASATMSCCADTVICTGSTAYLPIDISGVGPFVLHYTMNGFAMTDTITSIPYVMEVTTSVTATIDLVSIEGDCGVGAACGSATVAVDDCDPTSCCAGCFYSNVYESFGTPDGCWHYTMYISPNQCNVDLSCVTISVPCGTISNMYNDLGAPMNVVSNDPVTGLSGIQICANDYFDLAYYQSIKVKFTVCPDQCGQVLSCTPVVGFVTDHCVYYAQSATYDQTFNVNWNETQIKSWPNPFNDVCYIHISEGDFQQYMGLGQLIIVDINGLPIKTFDFQAIPIAGLTLKWDGTDDNGKQVDRGVYFINYRTSDAYGNRVDRKAGIRIIKQ